VSPAIICPINEIHILITDANASAEQTAPFERQGTRVIKV
jgi:DeoR/GlpR family transcriptional regulator of sugar metabolism